MTWQEKVVIIIRTLIGDEDATQYDDERILLLFLVAANMLLIEATFTNNYVIDMAESDITPDPSEDNDFLTLCCLKSACIMATSEFKRKTISDGGGKKITMKDGPSEITMDTSTQLASAKSLSDSVCKKYEDTLFLYNSGKSIGIAIVGPTIFGEAYQRPINRENDLRG
jgi:hypothetical protein